MEEFYEVLISSPENLKTVLSIKDLLPDLPVYMADRLVEKFKEKEGLYRVWKYKPNFCGVYFELNKVQYKVDIWTSEGGYAIYVFGQDLNSGARTLGWAEEMLSLPKHKFERIDDTEYRKLNSFSFYQEKEVIECVQEDIISEIQECIIKNE